LKHLQVRHTHTRTCAHKTHILWDYH
jgi:hypothetical protein